MPCCQLLAQLSKLAEEDRDVIKNYTCPIINISCLPVPLFCPFQIQKTNRLFSAITIYYSIHLIAAGYKLITDVASKKASEKISRSRLNYAVGTWETMQPIHGCMYTYKVAGHGLVEGADVEVENPVHFCPLDRIRRVQLVVFAVLVHQIGHNRSTAIANVKAKKKIIKKLKIKQQHAAG